MNRQTTTAAIALVLVLAALLGAPGVVASITEARVRERIAAIDASPAASAEVTAYSRGWFRSSARVTLRFVPDAATPLGDITGNPLLGPIPVALEFAHGPVAVLDGVYLGWSKFIARLDTQAPGVSGLEATLGVPYLFEFRGRTSYAGGLAFDADAPPFTLPIDEALLTFSGATLDGTFRQNRLEARGDISSVEMTSTTGTFGVSGIHVAAANELRSRYVLPGRASLSIERIAAIDAARPSQPMVEATNLRVTSDTGLDTAGELLDTRIDYTIDSVRVDDNELTAAALGVALRNLDVAALEAYGAAANGFGATSTATDPAELFAILAPQFERVLRAGPSLTIDPFRFRFRGEPFEGHVAVTANPERLPPAGALDLENPLLVLGLVDADAQVRLSKVLAQQLATLGAQFQLDSEGITPPDQRAYMAEAQSGLILAMLVGRGILVEEGNEYRSALEVTNGALTLNGTALPFGVP